ncbi:hypothetical protein BJX64DRAFT_72823 [Aspergillus heterothallicus]
MLIYMGILTPASFVLGALRKLAGAKRSVTRARHSVSARVPVLWSMQQRSDHPESQGLTPSPSFDGVLTGMGPIGRGFDALCTFDGSSRDSTRACWYLLLRCPADSGEANGSTVTSHQPT